MFQDSCYLFVKGKSPPKFFFFLFLTPSFPMTFTSVSVQTAFHCLPLLGTALLFIPFIYNCLRKHKAAYFYTRSCLKSPHISSKGQHLSRLALSSSTDYSSIYQSHLTWRKICKLPSQKTNEEKAQKTVCNRVLGQVLVLFLNHFIKKPSTKSFGFFFWCGFGFCWVFLINKIFGNHHRL